MDEFELDLNDPSVRRDPYPHFARLRDAPPVVRSRSLSPGSLVGGRGRAYVVHRYDDVRRAFADHRHLSSSRLLGPPAGESPAADPAGGGRRTLLQALSSDPAIRELLENPDVQANMRAGVFGGTTMISADGAEHDRLRGVVNTAFFPRQVSVLEGAIRELTQDLVRPLADRSRTHELMETLASPLPSIVIAELLGIPREDFPRFHVWSNAVIGTVDDDDAAGVSVEDPVARVKAYLLSPRRNALIAEFRAYLAEQIERYRVEPADNLISRMVEANEHDQLSADELTASTFLLLLAGNETTTRLIANLALALHRHPDQRALLVEDPALIPAAVEEGLRYDSPVQTITRAALAPVDVAGTAVPEGALVTLVMAAANRDPAQFSRPDRFDVRRPDMAHVSFGYGVHFCLGAPLARRETRIAFEELLKVAPAFRVVTPDDELDYAPMMGPTLRGPRTLHIAA
jgi:cytochrome P450